DTPLPRLVTDLASVRAEEFPQWKQRLADLVATNESVRAALEGALRDFNSSARGVGPTNRFRALLDHQHYLPSYWRTGSQRLNFRRFFDITSLAGLRVELPKVFEAVHGVLLQKLARGQVTGVRVDHPDGLRDPAAY